MLTMAELGTSSDKWEVRMVGRDMLNAVWPTVAMLLAKRPGDLMDWVKHEDIYLHVLLDEWNLWICCKDGDVRGAFLCYWNNHSKKKEYSIVWCGGYGLWQCGRSALEQVERYACLNGADQVSSKVSRPGLIKGMKALGYGERAVVLAKNVKTLWSS